MLHLIPSFCSTSAARMPSHVDASLIRMRSRPMPAASYSLMSRGPCRSSAACRTTNVRRPRSTRGPDQLQDLGAECDQQAVDDEIGAFVAMIADGFLEDRLVRILLDGLQDQRRVRGRVLRLVLRKLLEIARVGDDGRVLLQLVECGSHGDSEEGRKAPGSHGPRERGGEARRRRAPPPIRYSRPDSCRARSGVSEGRGGGRGAASRGAARVQDHLRDDARDGFPRMPSRSTAA